MGNRSWLRVAGVLGALALGAGAIAAGAAWAQDDGDAGDGPTFLARVAEKLGIEPDRLSQAVKDARSDEIDQAVADGKLTQEQADRLKQRLAELPDDAPSLGGPLGLRGNGHGPKGGEFGIGGPKGFHFGFGVPGGIMSMQDDLAAFLGITTEELRTELQADGASLASVAEARGKSRDELKAFFTGKLRERLAASVESGEITQERADEIVEKVGAQLDRAIDAERGGGGPFGDGPPGQHKPKHNGSPDDAIPDVPVREESESFFIES